MSTTQNTASLGSTKTIRSRSASFLKTTFALCFVLLPIVTMVMWVQQYAELSGVSSLFQDLLFSFGIKD